MFHQLVRFDNSRCRSASARLMAVTASPSASGHFACQFEYFKRRFSAIQRCHGG